MSMNLHVNGEREVTVVKTGKPSKQTIRFDLWQTPTGITKNAIRGTDPLGVYTEWVKSVSQDVTEEIYAPEDLFQEGEPIASRIYNAGTAHLEQLKNWLLDAEFEGYTIEFFEL